MNMRALASFAFAAFLCACAQGGEDKTAPDARNRSAAEGRGAPSRALPGEALEREVAAVAKALQPHVPLRQRTPQGMVTVSAVAARGAEMIQTIDVPQDLSAATFEQFRLQLPARMCEDMQIRSLVTRGGLQTYVVRDRNREVFTATISSCDPAPVSPLPDAAPIAIPPGPTGREGT